MLDPEQVDESAFTGYSELGTEGGGWLLVLK